MALTPSSVKLSGGSIVGADVPVYPYHAGPITTFSFLLNTTFVPRATSGSSSPITLGDVTYDRVSPATQVTDVQASVALNLENEINEPVTVTSLNTGRLSHPNTSGLMTFVSAGAVTVRAQNASGSVARENLLTLTQTGGQTVDTFSSFVSGSLAAHIANAVDSRIVGASEASKPVFSVYGATSGYVRNPSCWANVDLTCLSPWNSTYGAHIGVTLITPRHVVMCRHAMLNIGATIVFVKSDGTAVQRTLVAQALHPSDDGTMATDFVVGVLNVDVPSGILPCKVLPSTWLTRLPNSTACKNLPVLCFDQEEHATVAHSSNVTSNKLTLTTENLSGDRLALYESKIPGDSGNPVFFIISNELSLLSTFTEGGPGAGPFLPNQVSALNQMIVNADVLASNGGTGYILSHNDISSFPSL